MSRITTAQEQGKRNYQEDRVFTGQFISGQGRPVDVLAVMDGHGGDTAADQSLNRLSELFHSLDESSMRPELRSRIETLVQETRDLNSGSTLSVAVIYANGTVAEIAVLGDSPVLVVNDNGEFWKSPEHNVRANEEDADLLRSRGVNIAEGSGYIWLPGGGIQLTRSLGDCWTGDVLIRDPELFSHRLGAGSTVVLCTDGVIDPFHRGESDLPRQITSLALRGWTAQEILNSIQKHCDGFVDNATIAVWRPE